MTLEEYLEHAKREMFPRLKGSAISITILGEPDPKLCLELGAAILFDKPIIVVTPRGEQVPTNLKRVASRIVAGSVTDPINQAELIEAIQYVIANDSRVRPVEETPGKCPDCGHKAHAGVSCLESDCCDCGQ